MNITEQNTPGPVHVKIFYVRQCYPLKIGKKLSTIRKKYTVHLL